ncbi:hypothetical protein H310_08586 [Aphanomyces invadans]|uniref:Uncharacterized protein n=1 Tax=Aphanomyces invadans TaxID=157072 RepID=A0A024TYP0_9STRA|nr:hypothetical protein H310_08586 [Aphanomyces invadans]ETV98432.1 hypothetical protein H310_08586 [Aphanomyces invadans]|eukprot:XP_008872629.1 hypothetical protein H310_08586 [Aphanomyces invadans]
MATAAPIDGKHKQKDADRNADPHPRGNRFLHDDCRARNWCGDRTALANVLSGCLGGALGTRRTAARLRDTRAQELVAELTRRAIVCGGALGRGAVSVGTLLACGRRVREGKNWVLSAGEREQRHKDEEDNAAGHA